MAVNIQKVIQEARHLGGQDRALLARYLLASLDTPSEESVDLAWGDLAEKRYTEIIEGKTKTVDWEYIKKQIVG